MSTKKTIRWKILVRLPKWFYKVTKSLSEVLKNAYKGIHFLVRLQASILQLYWGLGSFAEVFQQCFWKTALERFKKHKDSQCHHKSILMSDIRDTNKILQMSFAGRMNHKWSTFGHLLSQGSTTIIKSLCDHVCLPKFWCMWANTKKHISGVLTKLTKFPKLILFK